MFTRTDLFTLRGKLTVVFHETADQAQRERAFRLIWKINERLLRHGRARMARPGWAKAA
jgi:hypothetical protein